MKVKTVRDSINMYVFASTEEDKKKAVKELSNLWMFKFYK